MATNAARMRELLRQFASHIRSDDANTDEFLGEGMTFQETLDLMDEVAIACVDRAEALK